LASKRLLAVAIGAAAALTLLAGACSSDDGGDEAVAANAVAIGAADYEFTVNAADFVPGMNKLTLTNSGQEDHQVQFVKLADGHTLEDLAAALADPTAGFPEWISATGGVGVIPGGGTATVTQNLEAGSYALLCFIEDAEGVPHFAKGMATQIAIAGDENMAAAPEATIEFTAAEYAFTGPDTVKAGDVNIAFQNGASSAEWHEAGLLKLADGFTLEMLQAALTSTEPPPEGPPPFTSAGGLQAYVAGGGGVASVNLEAGNYALICFVPNPEGVPHAALGMLKGLTVE